MCQAIREMIQEGREEGFMEGFMDSFMESFMDSFMDSFKDSFMDSFIESILISKKEMALSLSAMGMPAEKIAEVVRVSVALVRDWISGKDE